MYRVNFTRHKERGQTLPFQIFGILAMLSSAFLIYDWSMVVRLQISAQSEADAAAQLAVIPQVTQLNELSLSLYSANVEEYRLRSLLNALLLDVRGSGGCDPDPVPIPNVTFSFPSDLNCRANYPALRKAYLASVARYTTDVKLVETVADVTSNDQDTAMSAMISRLNQTCAATTGCDYHYVSNLFVPRGYLGMVQADGIAYSLNGSDNGMTSHPNGALTPRIADVTVCKTVKGILPSLFGVSLGPMVVYARSAATPIAVTEEWFEPGLTMNPKTHLPYQRSEYWAAYHTLDNAGFDSNEVHFSGNAAQADPIKSVFLSTIQNDEGEFSAYVNWWSTGLVHPLKIDTNHVGSRC
jgi:hypothetical protein